MWATFQRAANITGSLTPPAILSGRGLEVCVSVCVCESSASADLWGGYNSQITKNKLTFFKIFPLDFFNSSIFGVIEKTHSLLSF